MESGVDIASVPDEQILNGNQPDLDECENQDEDAVAMVEEPNSGIWIECLKDIMLGACLIDIFKFYLSMFRQ